MLYLKLTITDMERASLLGNPSALIEYYGSVGVLSRRDAVQLERDARADLDELGLPYCLEWTDRPRDERSGC